MSVQSPMCGSLVRGIVATAGALALLLPLLPGLAGGERARADFHEEAADQTPEPALWRVRAQAQDQSWADPDAFASLQFVSQERGYAALETGSDGPKPLLETIDGGDSWRVVSRSHSFTYPLPGASMQAAVEFIQKPNSDETIGFGYGSSEFVNNAVWRSRDHGRTWTEVLHPRRSDGMPLPIRDFAFTTPAGSGAVAVGAAGTRWFTHDSGESWKQGKDPESGAGVTAGLNAVDFDAVADEGDVGVAVGDGGTILVSNDDGRTWVDQSGATEISLRDVAVIRDVALGRTVAVAVGTRDNPLAPNVGVLAFNQNVSVDGDAGNWEIHPLTPHVSGAGADGGVPSLLSVALARGGSGGADDLVGYIAGTRNDVSSEAPLVLEMEDGDPSNWVAAPIDPRAAAFPARFPSPSSIQSDYSLQAVTVDPSGHRAAAVGQRLMLERTPLSESGAGQIQEDRWWRCVPRENPAGGEPTDNDDANQQINDAYGTVRDTLAPEGENDGEDSPIEQCRRRGEDLTPGSRERLGTTGALPCQLDDPPGDGSFPCVATWQPVDGLDGDGQPRAVSLSSQAQVWVDEAMADAGRRLVVVGGGRVFLFDPDRLEQRGVPGFGEGGKPGVQNQNDDSLDDDPTEFAGESAFGVATGVVKLAETPGGVPSSASMFAYDEKRHRLFYATNTTGTLTVPGESPSVGVLSLTGEFPPTQIEIPQYVDPDSPARTKTGITALAFDSRFGMLYVRTASNPRAHRVSGFPTLADDAQNTLHALVTGDDPETDEFELGGHLRRVWSVSLEDKGCRTAGGVLLVNRGGDAISFTCTGHGGPHFGMPNFEPHSIFTVRLRLGGSRHPSELSADDPGQVAIRSEKIGGKVFLESSVVMGMEARNVLAWNQQADGASLWDYDVGGWIGTIPFENLTGFTGLSFDADHSRRGRLYATCGTGQDGSGCVDFVPEDGAENEEPALLVVDTLNVPAQVPAQVTEKVELPTGPGFPLRASERQVAAAVPPLNPNDHPLVGLGSSGSRAIHLFEDRVAPTLERVSPDPDDRTFEEVSEEEAGDVKRIGRANAYGARLWWTGLGSATAVGCQHVIGDRLNPNDPCGSPTLSYDWLADPDAESVATPVGSAVPHGAHTSAVGGLPGGGTREMRLGEVQKANLENNKSGRLSDAEAVGLFYDGGPADDSQGNTGEDVSRRRGSDPHRFVDEELARFCETLHEVFLEHSAANDLREGCEGQPEDDPDTEEDESRGPWDEFQDQHEGHEDDPETDEDESAENPGFDGQFGPYEAAFEELYDRGMREIDGERQVPSGCRDQDPDEDDHEREAPFWEEPEQDEEGTPENEADCWEEFDRNDPRRDREGLIDRRSAFEKAEVVLPSECLEPAGKDEDSAGSSTRCKVGDFGRTQARGELNAFELVPGDSSAPEGLESLSIGATGSETDIFRDLEDGIVVETTAWASDVRLEVAGHGSLSIGEVRSVAKAQARGRDDTAISSLDVSFQDVVITGAGDPHRFSCGRSERDADPLSGDPEALPSEDECDPHEVVAVISSAFGGKVQATTSARDTDPKVAGSPGGAQAMVRRDPVDVLSDQVINRIQRHFELPALQLTIFNDGFRPNRMQIDLAAVYAETHYEIGLPAPELPPGGIDVSLSNFSGAPLPGGEFMLHQDGDGDGTLSSGDTPVEFCVTGGSGTCSFDALEAGAYLVEQRSAPPGFAPEATPRSAFVSDGSRTSVDFVNGPDGAGVVVELVDPSGVPLAGGAFDLVPDPDGDGAVEPSDAVAASCVTGDAGTCRFDRVDVGPWVLHQSAAPGGYETADDVAFALLRPGQVAEIRVVNGPAVAGATVQIVEIVNTQPASRSDGGAPWWAMLPKGLAALLLRNWVQALLFALTGMLFGAPFYLAHRRRELALATRSH